MKRHLNKKNSCGCKKSVDVYSNKELKGVSLTKNYNNVIVFPQKDLETNFYYTQNENLCTQNENLCTQNEKSCTQNENLCTQNENLCTQNENLCTQNNFYGILCTQNEKSCTQNNFDELSVKLKKSSSPDENIGKKIFSQNYTSENIQYTNDINLNLSKTMCLDKTLFSETLIKENIQYIIDILPLKNQKIKACDHFICNNCNKKFTRKSSMNRHKNNSCKLIINNKNKVEDDDNTIINNIVNTTNTINNIQINLNVNKIIPFDEEWNTSHLDQKTKLNLLLSSIKFTKSIEKILENDNNLNVLINSDKNTGIVYKNDIERFIPMNVDDIIDKSMYKLYNHLKTFSKDIKENNEFQIDNKIFDSEINLIENKYNEYNKNKLIQQNVQNHMIDIYNKNKKKIYNNFCVIEEDFLQKKIIGF